jgi:two-component system, LuxR family, response regulator FixJ
METQGRSANGVGLVAVVDDDAAVRNSLKFSLEIEGFDVIIFADGRQLLARQDLSSCDCVVVDQNLPAMNGLALIGELRRRHYNTPAILITTHPSDAIRKQAAAEGVPIVEKPLLNSLLFDAIRHAMSGRPRTAR